MRRIFFYLKMAGGNILRNRRFYLPYLLCCAGTAAMSYIVGYLCMDRMVDEMPGADYVRTFMWLGVYVMVFFSFFIIRFANSFIIKRRRRELGLYNILGLQKGNIAVLMAFETAILLLISLIFGLGIGILFSKLALLILAQVLSFGVPMGFSISGGAIVLTAGMLAADYLFCLVSNIWGVAKSSPVELLHSSNEGEREPKSRWLLAIFGILCLGGGYTIAVTTQNPLDALLLFFIAVILVIIGTYCLFTAVSVAVLKLLRKKKSFYYKPGPFTAVSGLLFRMKQNAVGMANICILATMVLVTISTTVSLYTGIGDVVNTQYPYEIQVELALNNYFDDSFHPAAEGDDRLVYDAAHNALAEGGYGDRKGGAFPRGHLHRRRDGERRLHLRPFGRRRLLPHRHGLHHPRGLQRPHRREQNPRPRRSPLLRLHRPDLHRRDRRQPLLHRQRKPLRLPDLHLGRDRSDAERPLSRRRFDGHPRAGLRDAGGNLRKRLLPPPLHPRHRSRRGCGGARRPPTARSPAPSRA